MYCLITKEKQYKIKSNPIDEFLTDIDVSDETRKTYQRQLRQFTEWLEQNEIVNPNQHTIIKYREHLFSTGRSQTTVKAYLLATQHLYDWLEDKGLCANITRGIRLPKVPSGFRKDYLEVDQARQLLSAFDRNKLQGARDFAITNLLLRCGLREIEIERANIEDIKIHNGQVVLYIQGKGMETKEDFVILTPDSLEPIHSYLKIRGETEIKNPLFASISNNNGSGRLSTRSISRIVKTALRRIGLDSPRLTCHSCRHSSITWARKYGGSTAEELQVFARHRHLSVTIAYCHNVDRIGKNAPEFKIDNILRKEN
jgi:site-specific recombinase XerD